jgi:predicted nucleic acid-binding protein
LASEVFFNSTLELFAPQFLLEELSEHQEELVGKTHLTPDAYYTAVTAVLTKLTLVSEEGFLSMVTQAKTICPDPDDITYFALALHLDCPVWSNDKALKRQDTVRVYSTHELLEKLSSD